MSNNAIYRQLEIEAAKRNLKWFVKATEPSYEFTDFHEKYLKIVDAFAQGKIKKLIVTVPPQHGKQLANDTPMLTNVGWTTHGQLKKGDVIFGRFGQEIKILNTSKETLTEFIIEFSDGEKIECHGNHDWVVFHNRKIKTVSTNFLFSQNLKKGDGKKRGNRYNFQIDANTLVDFKESILEVPPYVLGAWLGDGSAGKGCFTHHANDNEVIDEIKRSGYDISAVWTHKKTGVLTTSFLKLPKQLKKLSCFKNKSIPKEYLISSKKQRLELLAGLIDTDGYVYHKNGRVTFSNINLKLIKDVKKLVVSLGWRATICEFEPVLSSSGIQGKNKVYQLCFNPNCEIPVKILRKKLIKITPVKRKRAIVSIIKTLSCKKGKCIEVEGGIYLAGLSLMPTHNSLISTTNLPAYLFGINPDLKIAIGSYSSTFASKFNRQIQRKIDDKKYAEIFPKTKLNGSNVVTLSNNYLRNSEEFEIVNYKGSLKAVGRGGALTGNPVDIMVMDDLYKDYAEGNSPTIRESVWDWYLSVVLTRLHNDSRQLIVFTRWHEDDLIGRLEKKESVITINDVSQLKNVPKNSWVKINFEAIKRTEKTDIDPREFEEALFPSKHSLEKLLEQEKLDKHQFECLYQGNPTSAAGLLYSTFKTYSSKTYETRISKNYTDTADSGDNLLCSICYDVSTDGKIYITDITYTDEGMEKTEGYVAEMLIRNNTNTSDIESNNGGKSFARAIDSKTPGRIVVNNFHQSNNKESRIVSNQAAVNQLVYFPEDWHIRWSLFHEHITGFKKLFTANKFDDSADALTGVVEKYEGSNFVGIIW